MKRTIRRPDGSVEDVSIKRHFRRVFDGQDKSTQVSFRRQGVNKATQVHHPRRPKPVISESTQTGPDVPSPGTTVRSRGLDSSSSSSSSDSDTE